MIAERLARKRGARAWLTLVNTRAPQEPAPHPLSVFTAIVKHVSERAPAGEILYRCPGRDCRRLRLAEGRSYPLELLYPATEPADVSAWLSALRDYLSEAERNFALAGEPRIEPHAWDEVLDIEAAIPDELCLEFLTPFSFNPEGRLRTRLTAPQLMAAIERRIERVLGIKLALPREGVRVLPWYWEYVQFPHTARSEPGVKYLNGCVGGLYVKGAGRELVTALRLCADLHLGAGTAFGLGHYRLHETPVPYFAARFPDRAEIRTAVEAVVERYDDALPALAAAGALAQGTEALVAEIEAEIVSGYRPAPYEAFLLQKRDGSDRRIEKPALKDLCVQQCLHRLLAPVLDRMFEPESIGYRKGYSREHAAGRIQALLREGFRYVVESDIEEFFASVNLDRLEGLLGEHLPAADTGLFGLLRAFLRTGYSLDGAERQRERGLAQGAPLSPLFANFYLDGFDDALKAAGVRLIRYADDFVLLARKREEAERALGLAKETAAGLGLLLGAEKTAIRHVDEGFTFLGMQFGRGVEPAAELALPARKPLHVTEPGVFLGVNGEAVEIRKQGALLETLPLRRLSEILVMERAVFSSALIRKCARSGVPITLTLGSGYHIATLTPDSRHHHDVAFRQSRRYYAMSDTERLSIAREFSKAKVRNYISLFRQRYHAGLASFLAGLESLAEAMDGCDTVAALRGHEGIAARRIFKVWNGYAEAEAFRSASRRHEKPDRYNSLLNFGYYLLFSRINAALRALGLNPYLGFLHDGRDDHESLVCDIQEPSARVSIAWSCT